MDMTKQYELIVHGFVSLFRMFVSSDIFSRIGDLLSTFKGKFSFLSFDLILLYFSKVSGCNIILYWWILPL